ncbi:PspC domain-containing protein [Pseudonocardia sp. Cha107L01]|uniref:PspC domain-containing protein n=1 Tax=Pseudonocardia sp. Cha107L01 TaxID=3457576 RepID=UPI00403E93B8
MDEHSTNPTTANPADGEPADSNTPPAATAELADSNTAPTDSYAPPASGYALPAAAATPAYDPPTSNYAPPTDSDAPPAGTRRTPIRLHRSRDERMIAGVCGGLAETLGIDVVILRLALVLATVLGVGAGVILYVACWILMPASPLTGPTAAPAALVPAQVGEAEPAPRAS